MHYVILGLIAIGLFFVEVLSVVLFLLTLVCYIPYQIFRKKIDNESPPMTINQMPVLRPLPMTFEAHSNMFYRLFSYLYIPRKWQLVQNWHFIYFDKARNEDVELVVPKGFECDAASIPRPFRAFFSPTGLLLLPALLHDCGFEYNQLWEIDRNGNLVSYMPAQGDEKRFWDKLLYDAGMQVNRAKLVNGTIWLVRFLSLPTWINYRRSQTPLPTPTLPSSGDSCLCEFNP